MNTRQSVLQAYRLLLQFYPPAFRKRFAPEMLEFAEAAAPSEWPLIFGDTSIAIARCWIEGSPSTTAVAEPNAYVLSGSPVRSFGLGFILSTVIIAGLGYVAYRWPPPCQSTRTILTHVVAPPQSTTPVAEVRNSVRDQSTQK